MGELGGIQKLGDRYYITVSEGRIGIGESYKGPFIRQKKNPNMFGRDIYFPRFFHATPNGKPLVNHFYMNGIVYAAPLKDIEIDDEGILRLVWWKGNEKMKVNSLHSELENSNSAVKMWKTTFQKDKTYVIEGIIKLSEKNQDNDLRGLFFSNGNQDGSCIIFSRDKTTFGKGVITDKSVEVEIQNVVSRDLDLGDVQHFRIVLCNDMVEVYVNDYLTITKRVKYNGNIGIITGRDNKCVKKIRLWSS